VTAGESTHAKRAWAARAFTVVEDVVYLGLGLLLAGCSIALLVSSGISFGQNLVAKSLGTNIVPLLDRILLILLVIELLYTVQVSFREHGLIPEPFLLVGLIAGIRRVLVLTAQLAQVGDFRYGVSSIDRRTRSVDFLNSCSRSFAAAFAKTRCDHGSRARNLSA